VAGGTGGYALIAGEIGADVAKVALRVLDGERANSIPPVITVAKPRFNWQQMQHWNVSVSSLLEGSEIRFREPTFLEKYRWQSMAIVAALLIQAWADRVPVSRAAFAARCRRGIAQPDVRAGSRQPQCDSRRVVFFDRV
jgi:hypothetical protein